MDYSCWAFQNSYFIVITRSSLLNCPFGASITLLPFSTNLQQFFYKVTHPWTPYLYLEIEMLLIDKFSVFGYLEISNLFWKPGQEIFLHLRFSWCLAPIVIICSTLDHKVYCPECTAKKFCHSSFKVLIKQAVLVFPHGSSNLSTCYQGGIS